MRIRNVAIIGFLSLVLSAGCSLYQEPRGDTFKEVGNSKVRQWTGVAVNRFGRVFVSYPRWEAEYSGAVDEMMSDGTLRPYPDAEWNTWSPESNPTEHFVCVQSVYVDDKDRLWILDPASPDFGGTVEHGPKLVQVDLASNRVQRVIEFSPAVAPPKSYLNDVRVDTKREFAFITDSGLGAIVVVDLRGGKSWRRLEDHPSVKAEADVVPVIGGRPLVVAKTGEPMRVNSDGIALDHAGDTLYYQALTGRTLYSIATSALRDASLSEVELARHVKKVGTTVVTDGMEIDRFGSIYFSALEKDAVMYRTPAGEMKTLVSDSMIAWPDSFAWGPDGGLYFTTSQIHLTKRFSPTGEMPATPYRLFCVQAFRP